MATTNHTPTIELSQYVSTDKTSYLVNYNDDMLKIDGAIASDRDDIATAQNTADTAEGKADTNKLSIDAINETLNDNTTGVLKRLGDVEGDVNTIESLIGNGEPTTSDKTIIGAINELAGDNTDVVTAVNSIANTIEHFDQYVEVLADGTKDVETLMNEVLASFINTISALSGRFVEVTRITHWDLAGNPVGRFVIDTDAENPTWSNTIHISNISGAHDKLFFRDIEIVSNVVTECSQVSINIADSVCAYTNQLTAVPSSGARFRINYRVYKKAVRIS